MQPAVATTTDAARRGAEPWSLLGQRGPSLLEALFPGISPVQQAAVAAAFIALVAGLAQTRFFLPGNPVPITFQTFGVLLTGGVLGWRWGLASAIGYYLAGMAGVPVFQGGSNGWEYVTGGVTGGYLLGFILCVGMVGFLSQRGWNRSQVLWPMLLGSLLLYAPALIWLTVFDFGWPADGELFTSGMYAFIPGDIVKLMLASLAVGGGWRYVDTRRDSSPDDVSTPHGQRD